jgi:histidinol phosphatase-like PHP family hydrolase
MIDLHTHTTFSDGALIPAELARRAKVAGYTAIAITDHADASNLHRNLEGLAPMAREYGLHLGIDIHVGTEITHVPPGLIPGTVEAARAAGAQIVVVHGQTIVEPVDEGTNLAAIEAGADILSHPGLITAQEAELAAQRGVYLEITTRKGHSLTNGHVLNMARAAGAKLVVNNDAHDPGDLVLSRMRRHVCLGAGMTEDEYLMAEANAREITSRFMLKA